MWYEMLRDVACGAGYFVKMCLMASNAFECFSCGTFVTALNFNATFSYSFVRLKFWILKNFLIDEIKKWKILN